MTRSLLLPAAAVPLILLLGGAGAALAQGAETGTGVATPVPPLAPGTTTQVSPRATEPMPTQGPGQAPIGAAVTGSAPGPGAPGTPSPGPAAPSPVDSSQEQGGALLKPGPQANEMDAAAGAGRPPGQQAK
jgi:hypothetical protein